MSKSGRIPNVGQPARKRANNENFDPEVSISCTICHLVTCKCYSVRSCPECGGELVFCTCQSTTTLDISNRSERQSVSVQTSVEVKVLPTYDVRASECGKCIIFNNYLFNDVSVVTMEERKFTLRNRSGTGVDEDVLVEVFGWLGFIIDVHRDTEVDEMRKLLSNYATEDHAQYDVFVCVILSHGFKGEVFGVDGGSFILEEFRSIFERCSTLAGKPKLFFVQACQGRGNPAPIVAKDGPSMSAQGVTTGEVILPQNSDFLVAVATSEGNASFRHPKDGSWYIQSLCAILKEYAHTCHITEILTAVNNTLSQCYGRIEGEVGEARQVGDVQRFSLRKNLFLKPQTEVFADYNQENTQVVYHDAT